MNMARPNVEPQPPQPPQQPPQRATEDARDALRDLTSVLNDIMPILDRIQKRSPQGGGVGPFGQPSLETVAAVALVSDLGADSLRRLTAYLDAHAETFAGLETCAPVVAAAARALAARDYGQTFVLLFDVYRAITALRLDEQKLPAPGSVVPLTGERRRTGGEGSPPH
jgi:hypothetical protein